MTRSRVTRDINRIKYPDEKEEAAQLLCDIYKELLEGGWNPFDETRNEKLRKSTINILVQTVVKLFLQHHKTKGSRLKTIQSYDSRYSAQPR